MPISVEGIIHIQKKAIQSGEKDEYGLSGLVRDMGTLEYIVEECNRTNDPIEQASLALYYISNYHPFFEANKRTALLTAEVLLGSYYTLNCSPDDINDAIRHIATPDGTLEESRKWIKSKVVVEIV